MHDHLFFFVVVPFTLVVTHFWTENSIKWRFRFMHIKPNLNRSGAITVLLFRNLISTQFIIFCCGPLFANQIDKRSLIITYLFICLFFASRVYFQIDFDGSFVFAFHFLYIEKGFFHMPFHESNTTLAQVSAGPRLSGTHLVFHSHRSLVTLDLLFHYHSRAFSWCLHFRCCWF